MRHRCPHRCAYDRSLITESLFHRRGGHEVLEAEVHHDIAIVLVEVGDVSAQRREANGLVPEHGYAVGEGRVSRRRVDRVAVSERRLQLGNDAGLVSRAMRRILALGIWLAFGGGAEEVLAGGNVTQ